MSGDFRKSICIETLGLHVGFYERIRLAREAGFDTIEFWGKDGKDLNRIKALCEENGVSIAAFSGDAAYSLCDDAHTAPYLAYAIECMEAAQKLRVPVLVIHSNALGEGGVVLDHYERFSRERLMMNMLKTLLPLAPEAEARGITLALEPLNTLYDHIGNALFSMPEAVELTRLVGSPRVKVLFDVYHMQIMRGNLINTIRDYAGDIAHIHIADVPGRHEPGTGEINYPAVCAAIRESDYAGAVGFELFARDSFATAIHVIHRL